MGRAELRRQAKSRKKEQEKISKVLKNAGFPEFQLPPAPLKTTNLSTQEVANITGTKIAVLEQWRKEQTEEIRKACIMEAQEKLDQAENFITLCNIITSLKALEGFRYAKAAAGYLLEHYSESVAASEKQNIQETYRELSEKWGIEMEFEDPDLNKEMGFEDANWMEEYIGRNIPYSVYEKSLGRFPEYPVCLHPACSDLGAVRGFQLLEAQERRRKHVGQIYEGNQRKI